MLHHGLGSIQCYSFQLYEMSLIMGRTLGNTAEDLSTWGNLPAEWCWYSTTVVFHWHSPCHYWYGIFIWHGNFEKPLFDYVMESNCIFLLCSPLKIKMILEGVSRVKWKHSKQSPFKKMHNSENMELIRGRQDKNVSPVFNSEENLTRSETRRAKGLVFLCISWGIKWDS